MISTYFARVLSLSIFFFVVGIKTTEQEKCRDKLENCEDYNQQTCREFAGWAIHNCAKRCGLCTPTCPDGWLRYIGDDTCMKGFGFYNRHEILKWSDARQRCSNYGADLVVIKDENKHNFVLDHYSNDTYHSMWIGLHNVAKENDNFTFVYVDGSPLSTYHPWWPGNPNNHDHREKCVLMFNKEGYHGKWDDYSCRVWAAFVCSKPLF